MSTNSRNLNHHLINMNKLMIKISRSSGLRAARVREDPKAKGVLVRLRTTKRTRMPMSRENLVREAPKRSKKERNN